MDQMQRHECEVTEVQPITTHNFSLLGMTTPIQEVVNRGRSEGEKKVIAIQNPNQSSPEITVNVSWCVNSTKIRVGLT